MTCYARTKASVFQCYLSDQKKRVLLHSIEHLRKQTKSTYSFWQTPQSMEWKKWAWTNSKEWASDIWLLKFFFLEPPPLNYIKLSRNSSTWYFNSSNNIGGAGLIQSHDGPPFSQDVSIGISIESVSVTLNHILEGETKIPEKFSRTLCRLVFNFYFLENCTGSLF